jgi:hypothetical protein
MPAKLMHYPKGGPYVVRLVSMRADEHGTLDVQYINQPTLADARRYARKVRPEFFVTIFKPVEYRSCCSNA